MAPKTFIFIALILSGVFVCNIPAACLTHSADHPGIIKENHNHNGQSAGWQIETDQTVKAPLKYPRNILYSKSPAMYACNVKGHINDGMLRLKNPVNRLSHQVV